MESSVLIIATEKQLPTITSKPKKKDNDTMTMKFLLHKDRKEIRKMPTHKTAHLQTAQADTQPKFAKELFSC